MKTVLFSILFTLGLVTLTTAQEDVTDNGSADIRVTFSNSETYKGSYSGTANTRVCGQGDPMIHFFRQSFLFEYPMDWKGGDPIEYVNFLSNDLVGGVKTTTKFYVSVAVSAPAIGQLSSWAVDTSHPNDKSSGEATVTVKGADLMLSVKATNKLGEKLELQVTCHPPKKTDVKSPPKTVTKPKGKPKKN